MDTEDDKFSVRPVQLDELAGAPESMRNLLDANLEVVQDLKVRLTISVGGAQLSIGELFALKEGAMLKLDKATSEPLDIFLDDKRVARGELMAAEDNFAIRITEVGARS
jgi:flagellar motor switch protein FliN